MLIDIYRDEYECTPTLTIEGLKHKYNLTDDDLGDTSDWVKQQLDVVDTTPAPAVTPPPSSSAENTNEALIEDVKSKLLNEVLTRLTYDGHSLETKELKELTSIIDIIEKSYKGTQDSKQVNVLIQNIFNKYNTEG